MDRWRRMSLLLPPQVRGLPADLAVVISLAILTIFAVVTPIVNETPLRILLGLPFVLFLPGYAFIAALFPEAGEPPTAESVDSPEAQSRLRDRGIDGIERVALSFGLSIAIVPLIGLVLNFTPWGITLVPILLSVSGFTIACALIAYGRRLQIPEDTRFRVPYKAWYEAAYDEIFNPVDRTDATLNILLAASILLAFATVGFAIMVPPQGEQFTEFYILTEDNDGELVAANYPTEFIEGEGQEVILGIENNEHEEVTYTVVIQLQEESHENNETTVLDRSELDRFEVTLEHNETWREPIIVTPDMTGEDLRLQFLLYDTDDAPTEADRESAYRDLHLWIDVE